MYTLSGISSACLRSFDGALALRRKGILRLLLVGLLAGPRCSTAIVLFTTFSIFEVDATATGMVFLFWNTVVHCCTGGVLAPDGATAAMLGRAACCQYIEDRVDARAERGALGARRGFGVVFSATYCLGACLSVTATATAGSDTNGRGVAFAWYGIFGARCDVGNTPNDVVFMMVKQQGLFSCVSHNFNLGLGGGLYYCRLLFDFH